MFLTVFILFLLVGFRFFPTWATWYQHALFPYITRFLSNLNSILPFSIYDLLLVVLIVVLLLILLHLIFGPQRLLALKRLFLFVSWIYIGFYMLWGINYYAPGVTKYLDLTSQRVDTVLFEQKVEHYLAQLNATYESIPDFETYRLDRQRLALSLERHYRHLKDTYELPYALSQFEVKPSLWSDLYAATGVRGYYGPFTGEAHYNAHALPHEIPALFAHELSHQMGVTSEAEANLIGYLMTYQSPNLFYRFSGYYSLFPYILTDARRILPRPTYDRLFVQINPEIIKLYTKDRKHWQELYSETLGSIQHWLYNQYLKQNKITTGTQNYGQVVQLWLQLP